MGMVIMREAYKKDGVLRIMLIQSGKRISICLIQEILILRPMSTKTNMVESTQGSTHLKNLLSTNATCPQPQKPTM